MDAFKCRFQVRTPEIGTRIKAMSETTLPIYHLYLDFTNYCSTGPCKDWSFRFWDWIGKLGCWIYTEVLTRVFRWASSSFRATVGDICANAACILLFLRLSRSWTFLNAESLHRSRNSANERRAELGCSASALGWDCLGCSDCCRDSCPWWHFVRFVFYNDFFALEFEAAAFLSFSSLKSSLADEFTDHTRFSRAKALKKQFEKDFGTGREGDSREKPFWTHCSWSQPPEALCIVLPISSPFLCRFHSFSRCFKHCVV